MAAKKSRPAAHVSHKDNPVPQIQAARRVTEANSEQHRALLPQLHLIRIREQKNRERAIMVFLRVPEARVTLPGNIMGVSADHIEALEREGIPFSYVSKSPHGQ